MLKHGIYSVQDGSKLVRILIAMFIVVSIVYFVFGRKTTSHDQSRDEKEAPNHTLISDVNLLAPPIPDDIITNSKTVDITEGTRTVKVRTPLIRTSFQDTIDYYYNRIVKYFIVRLDQLVLRHHHHPRLFFFFTEHHSLQLHGVILVLYN